MNLKLLLTAGVVAIGFITGWSINGWRLGNEISQMEVEAAKAQTAAYEQTRALEKAARDLEDQLQSNADLVAQRDHARSETRAALSQKNVERIIKYVTRPAAHTCNLDAEFVSIYDATLLMPGASGVSVVPDSPGSADEATRVVRATDALPVIAHNNERCAALRDQVTGLHDFIRSVGLVGAEI